MADPSEDATAAKLQRLQTGIDAVRNDSREIKTRLSLLDTQHAILQQHYADLTNRFDRLETSVERIAERLTSGEK